MIFSYYFPYVIVQHPHLQNLPPAVFSRCMATVTLYTNLCRKTLMQASLQHIFLHKYKLPHGSTVSKLLRGLRCLLCSIFHGSQSPGLIPYSGLRRTLRRGSRSVGRHIIRKSKTVIIRDHFFLRRRLRLDHISFRIRRCLSLRLGLSGSRLQSALVVIRDPLILIRKTCVLRRRIRIREYI